MARVFLQKLEERRLTPEQKRRVGALITEPELKGAVLRLVRAWGHRQVPLPPLPPECLPLLEQLALQGDSCGEAVRLLAAADPAGVALLFRLVETDRQDWNAPIRNPRPCEWDRWSALFEHAQAIPHRIGQAYRENPAPWHLRLLARAGRWEHVFKAFHSPDSQLRREAAFIRGLALAPEEEDAARLGDARHGRILAESCSISAVGSSNRKLAPPWRNWRSWPTSVRETSAWRATPTTWVRRSSTRARIERHGLPRARKNPPLSERGCFVSRHYSL